MTSKAKRRKSVSVKPIPFVGDHGTGTKAATSGTVLEALRDERTGKANPNNVGRRRRTSEIDRIAPKLSMRQEQAARAISDAYCRVQMLSSGGELKEQVDASPKPDACVSAQVAAQGELARVMAAVPGNPKECREAVEQVCWRGEPISHIDRGKSGMHMSCLKVTLDLVANRLGY